MSAGAKRDAVAASVATTPIVGVVRTDSLDQAEQQARSFIAGGLELIEITFSVPRGESLVRRLLDERRGEGPPWIGMGTVTTRARAETALGVGSEFLVSPNTSAEVADVAKQAGLYLILGALTATEIVRAAELGADLVKVYPLPPVGGPHYLETVRQPLFDIPMLAGGGFGIEDIPAYARAGAQAFGIGAPLLGASEDETRERIGRALSLCSAARVA